ncbi:MAG: hypothetical protein U0821_02510 [Chloroflexota bacterium]
MRVLLRSALSMAVAVGLLAAADTRMTYATTPGAGATTRATDSLLSSLSTASLARQATQLTSLQLLESFDDPTAAWCRDRAGTYPDGDEYRCDAGEWVMRGVLQPRFRWTVGVGNYVNASLAVDVRLAGGSELRGVRLSCRVQPDDSPTEHTVFVQPALRRFEMGTFKDGEWRNRVGPAESSEIKPGGETNHLELGCVGDRISLSANGNELGGFQDDSIVTGQTRIGVASVGEVPLRVEARFDNLSIRTDGAVDPGPNAPPLVSRPPDLPADDPSHPDVLHADDFGPASGRCKAGELVEPGKRAFRCVDGEWQILREDATLGPASTTAPGRYANASISVDARIVGDYLQRYVSVSCREGGATGSSYRLAVDPARRSTTLARLDGGAEHPLVPWRLTAAVRPGNESNRLELACAGNRIIGRVNGVEVASAEDGTYAEGILRYGAGSFAGRNLPSDGRFDHLLVRELPAPPLGLDRLGLPPEMAPIAESFDAGSEWCAREAGSSPDRWTEECFEGEWRMHRYSKEGGGNVTTLQGEHTDTTMSIDARLVGGLERRYFSLDCRYRAGPPIAAYRLNVVPATGLFRLVRIDGTQATALADWQTAAVIRPGAAVNRLELSCVGTRISARINDREVASAEDATYEVGQLRFGAYAFSGFPLPFDSRFDNLRVWTK